MPNRILTISTACLLSVALLLAAGATHWQMHKLHRLQTLSSLETVLKASHQALKSWTKEKKRNAQRLAKDPLVVSLSEQLIRSATLEPQSLIQHQLANHLKLEPLLRESTEFSNRGYLMVDNSLRVLSSNQPEIIGQSAPRSLPDDFLSNILKGSTAIALPVKSQTALFNDRGEKRKGIATMFVASPIRDRNKHIIAAYIQRIDVRTDFTPLFSNNHLGSSGETYAFNRSGKLISKSRFEPQLLEMGLLAPGEDSLLNITLNDPGVDLSKQGAEQTPSHAQRLTLMAARATKGEGGNNLDGYRDYRGVEVLGSWDWNPELNIGITVEIDSYEAGLLNKTAIRIIWALAILALMIVNGLIYIHLKSRGRHAQVKQQLQSILENSNSPIYIKDRAGNSILANQAAESIQEFCEGTSDAGDGDRHVDTKTLHLLQDFDTNVLENKVPVEFEFSSNFKNKEHFYLMTKFPIMDHRDHIQAIGAIGIDITTRKNAEKTLLDRERFLLSLMSNLPGLVYRFNNDHNMSAIFISQGCLALTGYHPADFTGDHNNSGRPKRLFSELIVASDREQILQSRREALLSKKSFELEYKIVTSRKVEKWVWERGRGIFNSEGFITFTEGFVTDISDRKRINKELSAHRKHLARLVNERTHELEQERTQLNNIVANAADGICALNSEAEISLFSPAAQRITGYNLEEVNGKAFADLLPPHCQQDFQAHLEHIKTSGKQHALVRMETEISRKNGSIIQADLAISAETFNQEIQITVILQDITERKEYQAKLQKARDIAEEASYTKSEFLANMSHEIRTPMNAILGMAQLALRTELDDKQRRYLEAVNTSSKTLLGIINDILDFSKIEAGKLHIEKIPFELGDVLNSLTDMSAIRAQEKGLEFITHVETMVPLRLIGDPLRLNQILTNLCSNAVKFTHAGDILLKISVLEKSDHEITLEFSVKDSGIGLTPVQQEKLFQSFTQADASITREFGGTGLGLAICQNLVHLMGGEIGVSSTIGDGSTFTFQLPFGVTTLSDKNFPLPSASLAGTRILLVDDHPIALEMMTEVLESFSFTVVSANSAEAGLAILEQSSEPFQLVIIDWKMPGMNGAEATQIIKNNKRLHDIPAVLMVTAYGREDVIEKTRQSGADAYLIKPINTSTLFDTIIDIIGEAGIYKNTDRHDELLDKLPENMQGKHILLAEDNFINQEVAREFLESMKFSVSIVENGQDAVDAVTKNNYDAVLMDIQMPLMDGYSATQAIRKQSKGQTLPIIAMTANALPIDREKCLAAGMNDHMAKPIDLDHLLATLLKWMDPNNTHRLASPDNDYDSLIELSEELPESLPGLDVKRGLFNCAGNQHLLLTLLFRFAADNRGHTQEVIELCESENYEMARLTVHSIKSVSGNLGMNSIYEGARDLEQHLTRKAGPDADIVKQLTNDYRQCFEQACQSIEQLNKIQKT